MIEKVILGFVIGFFLASLLMWWRLSKLKKQNNLFLQKEYKQEVLVKQSDVAIVELKKELHETRQENKIQNGKIASLSTSNKHLEESISSHKSEVEKSNAKLKVEFENLSNKILESSSKKITEQSKLELDQILNPFKEKIRSFEEKVEGKHIQDTKDRAQLIEKISQLSELNKKMREEANNLTMALKGDSQVQGNWGELILERVLERSGLVKGSEYEVQVHALAEDGKRNRPDVVIYLPDNKHLIIDAKVSLTAYESLMAVTDPADKKKYINRHLISVKNHIKELNKKSYQNSKTIDSPDFVLMFMPIEASFSMAIREDNELYDYAWSRKVVIVSPSTLLATLKTISSLWKQEKQNRNALEIAKQAGALYDKFVGFTEDLLRVGQQLKTTTNTYDLSMKKLTEGTGNLVRRAERIKKLGIKTAKNINIELVEEAHVDKQQIEID